MPWHDLLSLFEIVHRIGVPRWNGEKQFRRVCGIQLGSVLPLLCLPPRPLHYSYIKLPGTSVETFIGILPKLKSKQRRPFCVTDYQLVIHDIAVCLRNKFNPLRLEIFHC